MSIADLETLYDSYAAAVDAENWGVAAATLSKIAIRIATSPVKMSRSTGGGGRQEIELDAQWVSSQQSFCRRMQTASAAAGSTAGPWQTTTVTYKRAT